jgi:tetratricopeptide (TPR) repeat protein
MPNDIPALEKEIAEAKTPTDKAELLNKLSVALYATDKIASWNAIRSAVDEARKSGNDELLAMSVWRLGASSRALGKMQEAITACEEALEIAREGKFDSIYEGVKNSLGVVYQQQGNFEKALELYEESLRIAEKAADVKSQASTTSNIGLLYVFKNDFRSAFKSYHRALQLYNEIGEATPLNLLINIAQLYIITGNYKESLDYLFKALPVARQQNNAQVEASVLISIIDVHYQFGQLEQAMAYIPETLALTEQACSHLSQIENFITLSRVYADAGEYDAAGMYIDRAAALVAASDHGQMECEVIFMKGYLHHVQQQYHHAIALYSQAIGMFGAHEIVAKNRIDMWLHRARAYETIGENGAALEDLQSALKTAEEIDTATDITQLYEHIARIHERTDNVPLALDFYKKYSERKIRQLSEAAWYETQNLLLRFETEKAQQQAELLRLRNESLLKDSELQQQELKMLGRFFVQTSEIMQNVRQQVELLKAQTAEETTRQSANKLLKYVKTTLAETENHRTFEHTFEKTHGAFLQQLAADFPALTQAEMRVSALLKTGLNTKEIASTLNLSTRTVEEHRGNIRRKIGIPAEVKLSDFFNDYGLS